MSLYLAIDAGGTKTNCLLADDTRILARASAGTVKLMRVSEEEATLRLQSMIEEVAHTANISLGKITCTCFGLAGITNPEVRTWASQIVSAMVAGTVLLVGDEEIALDAAFTGGPGILVIAGTGSNVIGRNAAGELFGAGGWGPVLGDEGSGYWIGLRAVRAALRAQDHDQPGAPSSRLLQGIQAHWEIDSLAELVAFGNQRSGVRRPAPDFSTLTPIVAACAQPRGDSPGDALAIQVLQQAGQELAEQVALVYRKMTTAREVPATSVGIAFTGSVLAQIEIVRAAMVEHLAVSIPSASVQANPVDPLDGALWRARNLVERAS